MFGLPKLVRRPLDGARPIKIDTPLNREQCRICRHAEGRDELLTTRIQDQYHADDTTETVGVTIVSGDGELDLTTIPTSDAAEVDRGETQIPERVRHNGDGSVTLLQTPEARVDSTFGLTDAIPAVDGRETHKVERSGVRRPAWS